MVLSSALPSATPPHTSPIATARHRIAVANIATPCRVVGSNNPFVMAIQNDNARKAGRIEFGAVGGGALVSIKGMQALSNVCPVTFEPHDDGERFDARMTFETESPEAAESLVAAFTRMFLTWARIKATDLIELDMNRENVEELVNDAPGILTLQQLTSIQTRLVGWKKGTRRLSQRGAGGVFTTPLYLCHEVLFEDPDVLDALMRDPLGRIKIVTPTELATTNGGQQEGRTRDGHVLFSNVFNPKFIQPL